MEQKTKGALVASAEGGIVGGLVEEELLGGQEFDLSSQAHGDQKKDFAMGVAVEGSLDALLMEVAYRRKPMELSMDTDQFVLVEWVRELYAKKRLLEATNPKLQGNCDVEEMERVLKLGLYCLHPEMESRPPFGTSSRVLRGSLLSLMWI
ncbi:hypothetical protein SUGI_0781920 [Cryptomeria japonica]|nr:hypothetical protein SUGI_0781920 [Cryptomeria japonica]